MDFFDKSFYNEPYEKFKYLRLNEPVCRDEKTNTYVLTKHEDVLFAFRNPEIFTSSLGARANSIPQPFMIDCDDPEHRVQRSIVERAFTPKKMQDYENWIRDFVNSSLSKCESGKSFDMVPALLQPLPVWVIGKILGIPESDYSLLQKWGEAMVEGADGWENVTDEVVQAVLDWFEYFDKYAKSKTGEGSDIVSALLNAHTNEGKITYEQAQANSLALLVGGNETARYLLTNSLYSILTHHSCWEEIVSDQSIIPRIVEECVRFSTPVMSSIRHTTMDVRVSDSVIPKGAQVMLMLASANRDEDMFEWPDIFLTDRKNNQNLGFGFGIHYCIGASLAKMQLRIVLEEMSKMYPNATINGKVDIRMKASSFLRGIKNLEVIL
jgi:cytochrome P450